MPNTTRAFLLTLVALFALTGTAVAEPYRDLIINNETDATLTLGIAGHGSVSETPIPPRTSKRFPDAISGSFLGSIDAPCVDGTPTQTIQIYVTGEARRAYEYSFRPSHFGKSLMLDKPSCPYTSSGGNTSECLRVVGSWRWFNGGLVDFRTDNTWQTTDGRHTGRWLCGRHNAIIVTPDAGSWRDTLQLNSDASKLAGSNEQGMRVTAVREGAQARPCPPGYNPYGCN